MREYAWCGGGGIQAGAMFHVFSSERYADLSATLLIASMLKILMFLLLCSCCIRSVVPFWTAPRCRWLAGAVIVVAVLCAAGLQLTLVSGVWFGPKGRPKGKMKLAIYFIQVGDATCRFGMGPVQVFFCRRRPFRSWC
jgi:hypothetical protein